MPELSQRPPSRGLIKMLRKARRERRQAFIKRTTCCASDSSSPLCDSSISAAVARLHAQYPSWHLRWAVTASQQGQVIYAYRDFPLPHSYGGLGLLNRLRADTPAEMASRLAVQAAVYDSLSSLSLNQPHDVTSSAAIPQMISDLEALLRQAAGED